MKYKKVLIFLIVAALGLSFFTACENPIIKKWWVQEEPEPNYIGITKQLPPEYIDIITELPPDVITILKNINVIDIDYITFSGSQWQYNQPGPATTQLTPQEIARNNIVINDVADLCKNHLDYYVLIVGHANPVDPEDFADPMNPTLYALSLNRANEVKSVLYNNTGLSSTAFPESQILTKGQGAKKVLEGPENQVLNRRAEVIVYEIETETP